MKEFKRLTNTRTGRKKMMMMKFNQVNSQEQKQRSRRKRVKRNQNPVNRPSETRFCLFDANYSHGYCSYSGFISSPACESWRWTDGEADRHLFTHTHGALASSQWRLCRGVLEFRGFPSFCWLQTRVSLSTDGSVCPPRMLPQF